MYYNVCTNIQNKQNLFNSNYNILHFNITVSNSLILINHYKKSIYFYKFIVIDIKNKTLILLQLL
jgi:hypothetical protein